MGKATLDHTPTTSDDELLARLIAAIGKTDAPAAERAWFEHTLRLLKDGTLKRLPAYESDVDFRDLFQKFIATGEKRRDLRRQFSAMQYELWRIRLLLLKDMPTDNEGRSKTTWLTNPETVEQIERAEEKAMEVFLEHATDYRKDPVRKLAIEPFIVLLRDEGVISEDLTAPRELPLNRMVDALLDYLGVKRRPTSIRPVVHDIKRDFPRRPSRRPKG